MSVLPRFLGTAEATLFVVTYTIGTAIFLVPGVVAANAGGVAPSLALWLAGGLLTLCGALCYAELAVRVPQSGGEYRYIFAAYGTRLAFVFAWTTLFFVLYPRMPLLQRSKPAVIVLYGVVIWLVMNQVVLRLSRIGVGEFDAGQAAIAALILIVMVALPIVIGASRYYAGKSRIV